MKTLLTAAAALSGCTAARWYLDRSGRRDSCHAGGHVRLRTLRNRGAAFGLGIRLETVLAASAAVLGGSWFYRKKSPVGVGLLLGGGLSNLLERLRRGEVYDYVQFPKAPGPLKRYVFNLADFAIILGGCLLALGRKEK